VGQQVLAWIVSRSPLPEAARKKIQQLVAKIRAADALAVFRLRLWRCQSCLGSPSRDET